MARDIYRKIVELVLKAAELAKSAGIANLLQPVNRYVRERGAVMSSGAGLRGVEHRGYVRGKTGQQR